MKPGWRVLVVCVAVAAGLFLSKRPWEVYREQQAKATSANRAMQDAERERELLMTQKSKLTSPVGREEIVRAKGYHKPGETSIPQ